MSKINDILEKIYNDENLHTEENLEYFEKIYNLCNKLKLEPTDKNLDILFDSLINNEKFPFVIKLLIEKLIELKSIE